MASLLKNVLQKMNWFPRNQNFHRNIFQSIQNFNFYSSLTASNFPTPYEIVRDNKEKETLYKTFKSDIVQKIREKAKNKREPLFAVVHVAGKQFKITSGDIIVIEGYWPPNAGDKLLLDKVMLVGGKDFSLIGKPLIERDLVQIDATVIEKTLSHTKIHFRKKRRKQYKRINFYRIPQTMLQINTIRFIGEFNNPPDVSGPKTRTM